MTEKLESMPQKIPMPKRNPIDGTFELTIRCNLHCKMCLFRHDDKENPQLIANELTAKQWIDLAKQAAKAGTFSLLITGGEPMLRPDFCEIWEGIYKLGFLITLYTNATLITPQIMKTLQKYPPHKIGITIYGASSNTYAKVCGNGDAFYKMLSGAKQLNTLPSIKEFRTTIIKDNYDESMLIDELVSKEFDFDGQVKQASPINKSVRGACANVENCRLSPELDIKMKVERLEKSLRQIIGPKFDVNKLVVEYENEGISRNDEQKFTLFGCEAGMSQYTITYNGKLLACQMIDAFSTDALHDGLQIAWDKFPYMVQIPNTDIQCEKCKFVRSCQSCYASRYAETGNFNACSEYIYQIARLRSKYKVLGGKNDEKC